MSEILQPYDYLVKNFDERPDEVACTDGQQTHTWKSLYELTKRIARTLRDAGIQPGDEIGLRLPPMLTVIVTWAIFHEAAIAFPFTPEMTDDPTINTRLVMTNRPIDGWPKERTILVTNEWFERVHVNSTVIEQNRYPSLDSTIRYALSNGTTGRPKLMPYSSTQTASRSEEYLASAKSQTVAMSLVGTRAENGFYYLFGSAMAGVPYLIPNHPEDIVTLLESYRVDSLRASPNQLATLTVALQRMHKTLPDLKHILVVGGFAPARLKNMLRGLTEAQIGTSYEVSEVGSIARRYSDSDDDHNVGDIDPNMTVEIVDDETLRPVPDGEVGLIRVRHRTMLHENLHDPDFTEKNFVDGWFYPGDRGFLRGGQLHLEGRKSDFINSGGTKTDPLLVDNVYLRHPDIDDAATFALPDSTGIDRIALAYVSENEISSEQLREFGHAALNVRTPVWFFRVPIIPRSGELEKVQRDQLPAVVAKPRPSKADATIAATPTIPPVAKDGSSFTQPFSYVERAALDMPFAPALIETERALSRRDVYLNAKQFAALLRERGVQPGDIVAINLPLTYQLAFTLAVFHEAAVVAPFVPFMLNEGNPFGVKWIVTNRQFERFPAAKQIVMNDETLRTINRYPTDLAPRKYESADSLMRLAFSSGTTGVPKAIPFSVAETETRSRDHESRTLSRGQFMCLMPPKIGMGWWSWWASVLTARPYLVPGDNLDNLRLIRRYSVDSIMASPNQLEAMLDIMEESETAVPDLATIQAGGSHFSLHLVERLQRLTTAQIVNAYGSTEVGPTTLRLDDGTDPAYVGELLPGAEAQIVDPETHEPLPEGEIGLLRVKRHTMVHEYLGNPEATAESWRDGWFYSGDVARLDGSKVYLEGRQSEVINIGGSKVDPAMIDDFYANSKRMKDRAAFAVPDDEGDDMIVLAYVADEEIDEQDVYEKSRGRLQKFTPTRFVRIDAIPRNELGKPKRAELAQWFVNTVRSPMGETE